jgi:hypothetical protein
MNNKFVISKTKVLINYFIFQNQSQLQQCSDQRVKGEGKLEIKDSHKYYNNTRLNME